MSETKMRKREHILPFPALLLMVALFVGAAFFLIPKEEELMKRFLEDNNTTRAKELLDRAEESSFQKEAEEWLDNIGAKIAAAAEAARASGLEQSYGPDPVETLDKFLAGGVCRPGEVEMPDLIFARPLQRDGEFG